MSSKLYKIFKKNKNIIIGAIHFPPLLGYPDFPGFEVALNNALKDLDAFEKGGVDGIIIENNYDISHKIEVSPQVADIMKDLGKEIKKKTKLAIGVSVLWNDFKNALLIAKLIDGKFIRIPVFVDKVKTSYGIITGNPKEVIDYRKKIKAENIALFTDIQVKHAQFLNKRPIEKSATEAIRKDSDALIITGKWTGQAPDLKKLERVKKFIGNFPILIGSGANKDNVKNLLQYANGIIVSTSLKKGRVKPKEVNVKTWQQRIEIKKVKEFLAKIK